MWECAVHSWLCSKWGPQTWLHVRNNLGSIKYTDAWAPIWRFCVQPGDIWGDSNTESRQRTTAWKVDAVGVWPLWDVFWCIQIHLGLWKCLEKQWEWMSSVTHRHRTGFWNVSPWVALVTSPQSCTAYICAVLLPITKHLHMQYLAFTRILKRGQGTSAPFCPFSREHSSSLFGCSCRVILAWRPTQAPPRLGVGTASLSFPSPGARHTLLPHWAVVTRVTVYEGKLIILYSSPAFIPSRHSTTLMI